MAESSRLAPGPSGITWAALAILVAVHVGVVASIVTADRPVIWPLHNDTIHREGRGADFFAVYHAAVSLQRGQDPYAVDPDGITPYFYAFRYLPIVGMAAEPLTALRPETAYVVWVTILEVLLAALLTTLWRRLPQSRVRAIVVGLLLVNSPYFLELYMGQFTFASVVLCGLGLLLPAGAVMFATSVLLKPFTLAAVPAMAAHRRYWPHLIAALVAVVALSLPYFLQHPVQRNIFLDANFNPLGGFGIGNVGLVQLLSLIVDDTGASSVDNPFTLWMSGARLLVLAATALLVWRARVRSPLAGVCALLLAHFLTYQQVWEHHMSAVIVLGALLVILPARPAWLATTLTAMVLLALPTPFAWFDAAKDPAVFDPTATWPRYALYLVVLSKVAPTLMLFASALASVRRDGLLPLRTAFNRSRFMSSS